MKQVFMSHSRKDALVKRVYDNEIFAKTNVKPIWMEYEKWSQGEDEPNWSWISRYVQMPETIAVFVLLTRNVIDIANSKRTLATQNWVSYEIGVASVASKPVLVVKEEDVDFPVPYLTNYMPYSILKVLTTDEKEWLSPQYADIVKSGYTKTTRSIIRDFKEGIQRTPNCRCEKCLTSFYYHGVDPSFACPCCSEEITTPMHTN